MKMYIALITYSSINEKGNETKTKEHILFDALSYTEAEKRAYEYIENNDCGEGKVENITKKKIDDVILDPTAGFFFMCKVVYADFDENTGKEKNATMNILVEADSLQKSIKKTTESLSEMVVPYEFKSVTESPILEYIEYDLEANAAKIEVKTKLANAKHIRA